MQMSEMGTVRESRVRTQDQIFRALCICISLDTGVKLGELSCRVPCHRGGIEINTMDEKESGMKNDFSNYSQFLEARRVFIVEGIGRVFSGLLGILLFLLVSPRSPPAIFLFPSSIPSASHPPPNQFPKKYIHFMQTNVSHGFH